jgi:hypothetical protein
MDIISMVGDIMDGGDIMVVMDQKVINMIMGMDMVMVHMEVEKVINMGMVMEVL